MESGKLPNRGFMPEKHKHVHARQNSMRDKEWMMIRNKLISHLRHLTNQLKLLPSKRPKTRPYYQIKTGQIKYSPLPQLIGKGQFGSVYLFSMLDTVTQQEIKVAGKTLAKLGNDIYSLNQLYELIEEDRFEFHRELMMLAHIQKHKNFEFDKNKGKKLLTEYEIQYGQTQMGHENMLGFEGVYVPENCPPGFFDADYNYDLEIWCSGNNRESVKDPTAMQKITGKMLANMIMILPFYDGGDLKHLLENPKYSNNDECSDFLSCVK